MSVIVLWFLASCYILQPVQVFPIQPFNTLLSYNLLLFFLGDINAPHKSFGNSYTSAGGRFVYEMTNNLSIHHLGPSFHTFFSGDRKGTPDVILINDSGFLMHRFITAGPPLGWYHIPVIKLSSVPILIPGKKDFQFHKANTKDCISNILKEKNSLVVPNDVVSLNSAWEFLTNIIQTAQEKCVPKSSFRLLHNFTSSLRTKRFFIWYQNTYLSIIISPTRRTILINHYKLLYTRSLQLDFHWYWSSNC